MSDQSPEERDPFAAGGWTGGAEPAPSDPEPGPPSNPDNVIQFPEWRDHRSKDQDEDEDKGGGGGGEPPAGGSGGDGEPRPTWCSDDALAIALADKIKDDFRYVPGQGWMHWTGKCWVEDDENTVVEAARENCRNFAAGQERANFARTITSDRTISATVKLARSDRRIVASRKLFSSTQNRGLLNTPGGIVDLKTGILGPHRREAYLCGMTAVAPEGECPNWLRFIAEFTGGDETYAKFLQRVAGYCLTGWVRRPAWFFLIGEHGGEGKSKFIHALQHAMGDYAVSAMMGLFVETYGERHQTELAALAGKRLVVATETSSGQVWDEAKIKALTGEDRLSARVMRGDPFEFDPICKLLMSGNHKPRLKSADTATRDRLLLLPALHQPAERDEELGEKFERELGGILLWAIEGAVNWAKQGVRPPKWITQATDEYFVEQNSAARWFRACCEPWRDGEDGPLVKTRTIYQDFQCWQKESGEKPWSEFVFTQKLKRIPGVTQTHSFKEGRGWRGFRLRTVRDDYQLAREDE